MGGGDNFDGGGGMVAGRRSALAGAAAGRAAAVSARAAIVRTTAAGGGGAGSTSNRGKVTNALARLCLAGAHRAGELRAALSALENSNAPSFLILLASPEALLYRGLYEWDGGGGTQPMCQKIHGSGPASLTPAILTAAALEAFARDASAADRGDTQRANIPTLLSPAEKDAAAKSALVVDACFKYNTSTRAFAALSTRSVTLTTDAVTVRARFAAKKPAPLSE